MAQEGHDFLAYSTVLIMVVIALIIALVILLLNRLLGQRAVENSPKKADIYECGVTYEGDARQQFSVRYYLIGIVFLLFDVELVFMYPWTIVYNRYLSQGPFIMLEMAMFVLLLIGGYVYLRRRGALSWD